MSLRHLSPQRRLARAAATALAVAALASGCAVGPDYQRPAAPTTPAFKEAAGWRPAAPADHIDRGAWWSMFHDPVLDGLERQVATSNQTVKQFEAAYRESHALVDQARGTLFPTLSASVTAQRTHVAAGTSSTGLGAGGGSSGSSGAETTTRAAAGLLEAAWAPDLWGRIRRTVESQKALAQASAADLANARLLAEAALAQDYFQLRILDEQARLYRQTVADYEEFLRIVSAQFREGTAPLSTVVTARTQLLNTRAGQIGVAAGRAQMEHAIAVLTGVPPASFTLAPAPLPVTVPVAPAGVPSMLLERRPDIASAERQAAAANARVGAAIAAYFPDVTLTAQYGAPAGDLGRLFTASRSLWALGADAAETLLDFGQRRAQVRGTRAVYDEEVAAYRQTVLTAFQGVEDQLAALRVFEQQEAVLIETEAQARQAVRLDRDNYREGVVDYTAVIVAQAAAFAAAQNVLNVRLERYRASVLLVENLGGGWTTAELPRE